MTKPLIQQLAERIGLISGVHDVSGPPHPVNFSPYATARLLFELCAYLDEQAAEFPFCSTHDRAGGCDECAKASGPEPLSEHVRRERRPPPPDEPEVACDHHAAIHELNRELVEAREAIQYEREQANKWLTEKHDLEKEAASERERERGVRNRSEHRAELARVTAERDELKAQLAWEKAWDLHTKVAMGAVVEAARAVYRRIDAEGKLEYHGHQERPGGCESCRELNALANALFSPEATRALTAAAAKPAEP